MTDTQATPAAQPANLTAMQLQLLDRPPGAKGCRKTDPKSRVVRFS